MACCAATLRHGWAAAFSTISSTGPWCFTPRRTSAKPWWNTFCWRPGFSWPTTDTSYRSKDLSITVTAHTLGKGSNRVAYYVADVYTTNIRCFRTYFSQDTYGSGFEEHLTKMSRDVQAVLAMNGDSYCYNHQHTAGALIRNGTVYRAEPTSADVCVLF